MVFCEESSWCHKIKIFLHFDFVRECNYFWPIKKSMSNFVVFAILLQDESAIVIGKVLKRLPLNFRSKYISMYCIEINQHFAIIEIDFCRENLISTESLVPSKPYTNQRFTTCLNLQNFTILITCKDQSVFFFCYMLISFEFGLSFQEHWIKEIELMLINPCWCPFTFV